MVHIPIPRIAGAGFAVYVVLPPVPGNLVVPLLVPATAYKIIAGAGAGTR